VLDIFLTDRQLDMSLQQTLTSLGPPFVLRNLLVCWKVTSIWWQNSDSPWFACRTSIKMLLDYITQWHVERDYKA